ncbi:MAG: hypothetical protein KC636_10550 [Myxococcales bacterium]|nr:hypothetical protein [Myxococcales bacterium]
MILCVRVEQLRDHLTAVGPLLDRHERGDLDFPTKASAWLREAEATLTSLRLPEDAAALASLRAEITKAGEVARAGGDAAVSPRALARRARVTAAADALAQASARLRERVLEASARLEHFEEKLIEAMTAAVLVDLIPLPPTRPWERWLARAWQGLVTHAATRPTAAYMGAALRSPDRLYLLDRVLTRLLEVELPLLEHAGKPARRSSRRKLRLGDKPDQTAT